MYLLYTEKIKLEFREDADANKQEKIDLRACNVHK